MIHVGQSQTSVATSVPVELLLYIFSSTSCQRLPGPLPNDQEGLSELYKVTWGKVGYEKQVLTTVARVCRSWNRVATYLLYDLVFVTSAVSVELLLRTIDSESWKRRSLRLSDIVFHPNDGISFTTEGNATTKAMISCSPARSPR